MTSTQILLTIVVLLVIVAIGVGVWFVTRRRALQARFGPEYDRAVAEGGNRLAVERELRERERRHAQLELRELDPESRARYTAAWEQVQARFLDDPNGAVREGDELVTRLIAERGYPSGEYDDLVAHLSVEHARTLGHYRDAHEISLANDRGEATTEQLRQALVHLRTLFADLLGTDAETIVRQPNRDDVSRAEAEERTDERAEERAEGRAEERADDEVRRDTTNRS